MRWWWMLSVANLLAVALLLSPLPTQGTNTSTGADLFLPANGQAEYRLLPNDMDAGGNPFQICLQCRCCSAADPNTCSPMQCCYGIDCNLPDKPFGVCAFVPKVCDCTDCS